MKYIDWIVQVTSRSRRSPIGSTASSTTRSSCGWGWGAGRSSTAPATGRLHRLHRGVYAVGRKTVSRKGRWLAGVRACGPEAVLSHRSAAALWGLLRDSRAAVDVTVPGRTRRGSGNLVVHNVRRLHPDDRRRREHIPVTSVARTLLDVAEVVPPRRLARRAVDEAERLRLFDLRAVDELSGRSTGRRGVPVLNEALHGYRPTPPVTRSDLERPLVEMCDRAHPPRPATNLFVAGYEVDAAWPDHGVVVEVDSFEFHRTRAAFEPTGAATPRCSATASASCVSPTAGCRTTPPESRRTSGRCSNDSAARACRRRPRRRGRSPFSSYQDCCP